MLRLWTPEGVTNRCCAPEDLAAARRVAGVIGIPFYPLDAKDVFKREVVDSFIQGYASGITPNPCLECNRKIRWRFLLRHALGLGATHLATGHYARVRRTNGRYRLLRGCDPKKDQSYVLSVLGQEQLSRALLPLGEYTKEEVRAHAQRLGLPVVRRPESQDLCFVGEGGYRDFLLQNAPRIDNPGPILSSAGDQLGQHDGLANYTIGQRRRLGISAPHPLYVLDKDRGRNALIVGPREELGRNTFSLQRVNWVSGVAPEGLIEAEVQVRYQAPEVQATVHSLGPARAEVHLTEPVADVTPGQSAVFYHGEECLGGGIIEQ
jgi:tRNA-specific 2-thiouridylase